MRTFKINNKITLVANSEKTRNGFRHRATLIINGREADETTVNYTNRTWESYEYQTVMQKLVNKTSTLSSTEKQGIDKYLKQDHTDWGDFKMTSMVAQLGDVLLKKKKEKNVWKTRMLKAGLGHKGLQIPEGWDKLPEGIKQKRLNQVINVLSKKKSKKIKPAQIGSAEWLKKETTF